MGRYDAVREKALANIELLFDYWALEWKKINSKEIDFINPTRKDNNYGACRFNVEKGRGADFTGSYIKDSDVAKFGPGFTREDFLNIGKEEQQWGFDIIGLCQKLRQHTSYDDAYRDLRETLQKIAKNTKLVQPAKDAATKRLHKIQEEKLKILQSAEKIWKLSKNFENTIGDDYLRGRKIFIKNEPNIKFLAKVKNTEKNNFFPALIFKVGKEPNGHISAIHRIYLKVNTEGGLLGHRYSVSKLNCNNPKVALGSIAGSAIWFGTPGHELCIAEGPENALSLRCLGYPFVASSVFANNFSNIDLPFYVAKVNLFPDSDQAGIDNNAKALRKYAHLHPTSIFPPQNKDWNDVLIGGL